MDLVRATQASAGEVTLALGCGVVVLRLLQLRGDDRAILFTLLGISSFSFCPL